MIRYSLMISNYHSRYEVGRRRQDTQGQNTQGRHQN